MTRHTGLDCIVIGYNELPFASYERLLGQYGRDSEAYRDFRLSFAELDGEGRLYTDLMNYAAGLARGGGNGSGSPHPSIFRSGEIPNLAAAYLTNCLHRQCFSARYVNLFQDEKERLAALLADDPVCVAITTTFYVLNFPVNDMVEFIRRHNPRVRIVVGGPLIANHTRNFAGEELRSVLADLGADIYVVESQGELTLARIVACLKAGGDDLETVPNLLYFEDGRLCRTLVEPESNSLDENYIDWARLAGEVDDLGPTLQTRTARSCAFSCAFCNYPARAGKLTLLSLEVLEQELESIRRLGNVRNLVFIDDTFNVPIRRFKDICRLLIDLDLDLEWYSYFRCSNSDQEAIELMAESGCKGVFLGIESGSTEILRNMNKKATVDKYLDGIETLRRHGILTFGSFITGFPGETQASVAETDDFIRQSGLDYYRTQLWYCEAGTPIDQQREKYGIEGDGFVWSHATMDSLEAMDAIERTFLSIRDPVWLPQWSFDFWIIPYLRGKGVRLEHLREFCRLAHQLTALGIAAVSEQEKAAGEAEIRRGMIAAAGHWTDLA